MVATKHLSLQIMWDNVLSLSESHDGAVFCSGPVLGPVCAVKNRKLWRRWGRWGSSTTTRARFPALSDVGDYVKEEITRMILNEASF